MHYFPANTYTITTGASSVASGVTFGTGVQAVLLVATVACRVAFGVGSVTAVATSTIIPANFPVVLKVRAGSTMAAIEVSAAGVLSITELV